MATSISSSIIACLKSFNDFIEEIRSLQDKNVKGLVASSWEDELGRLRMWAANIGAHQTGQSSLDFRLRDASHIREQIIKLLHGLLRRLQDARDVLADDEESHDEVAPEDDALNDGDRETEIQELQESLATNVNCLFQMSLLVRKPAQHDLYLGSRGADVAAFGPFDYNHVKEKFPEADDALVRRLGYAITRRRRYLKYRERHAMKLRQGISNLDHGFDIQEHEIMGHGTESVLSSTIVTELEQRNIDFDDKASDTDVSQTSYAPTLLRGGNLAIPPPPKASLEGVPFECPYCFYMIKIDGIRAWNKHIFQDLQPYICIAPTCLTPDKLYSTRHEWLDHMYMAHTAVMTHEGTKEESKSFVVCVLCQETFELRKQYERHLARHLQELALFVLPSVEEDSDVGEDGGATSSSDTESVSVAISHDRPRSLESLPAIPIEHQAAVEGMESLSATREKEADEDDGEKHATVSWKPKETWRHLEEEVEEKQRLLGSEHPDTLVAMTELTIQYIDSGLYKDAAYLGEQVTRTKKNQLGEENPETLHSIFILGQSYQEQKRLAEAEILFEQAWKDCEKVYGSDHKLTIVAARYLGSVYRDLGRLDKAEMMYERTLSAKEKTMGPYDISTVLSIMDLADIYQKLSKLEQAESLYSEALVRSEKTKGRKIRPSSIMNRLIDIYKQQGKLAEAEELSKRMES